jgi:hypothetical protein
VQTLQTVQTTRVVIRGWGADPWSKRPAREVVLVVDGKVRATAIPKSSRPDVAKAIGSPPSAGERFGFLLQTQWSSPRTIGLPDFRFYVVSEDGTTRELATAWYAPPTPRDDFPRGEGVARSVDPAPALGFVDGAQVDGHVDDTLELPADVRPETVNGLEFEVAAQQNDIIALAVAPARLDANAPPMAMHVAGGWSGNVALLLDNCPQWHALSDRKLYLSHSASTRIKGIRVMTRTGARRLIAAAGVKG